LPALCHILPQSDLDIGLSTYVTQLPIRRSYELFFVHTLARVTEEHRAATTPPGHPNSQHLTATANPRDVKRHACAQVVRDKPTEPHSQRVKEKEVRMLGVWEPVADHMRGFFFLS